MMSGTDERDTQGGGGGEKNGSTYTTPAGVPTGDEVKSIIQGLLSKGNSPAAGAAGKMAGRVSTGEDDGKRARPSTVVASKRGPDAEAASQRQFFEVALHARSYDKVVNRCGVCNRAKNTTGSRCVLLNEDGSPCEFVTVCTSHLTAFAGDICEASDAGRCAGPQAQNQKGSNDS